MTRVFWKQTLNKRGQLIRSISKDANTKRIDPVDATLAAFKLALYHDFEIENMNDYVTRFLEEIG